MNEKPRPRWFRFGLRTLFIVVTVFCCWLAWEVSVVRQRQAVLAEYRANGTFQFTPAEEYKKYFQPNASMAPPATIPRVRSWLGDQAIQEIWYFHDHTQRPSEADLQRVAKAFPEAQLRGMERQFEPCHPGCFPRGTPVETPSGPQRIESIQAGDRVIGVQPHGETASLAVQAVFVTENRLWKIDTEAGALVTTQTQPLCMADGQFLAAGELQPNDTILRFEDGAVQAVNVIEVSRTERVETVYNLILGDSQVFLADGFLARSKPPAAVALR